jgi:hypothetical protein
MNLAILVTGSIIFREIYFLMGLIPLFLIYIYLYKISLEISASRITRNYNKIMEIQYE